MKLLKLMGTDGNPIIMDSELFCAATAKDGYTTVNFGDEHTINVVDSLSSIAEQLQNFEND